MSLETRFHERMSGYWIEKKDTKKSNTYNFCFEIDVRLDGVMNLFATQKAFFKGFVTAENFATNKEIQGVLETSPFIKRQLRYSFSFFNDEGVECKFDGWKSIAFLDPLRTWTTLPGTLKDMSGNMIGEVLVKFNFQDTFSFLSSFRLSESVKDEDLFLKRLTDEYLSSRKGRLEVWYDTFSDDKHGYWIHHELISSIKGETYSTGWIAIFELGKKPIFERFEDRDILDSKYFKTDSVSLTPIDRIGKTKNIEWDIKVDGKSDPLYTFGRLSWKKEILPASQIVPLPTAKYTGTIKVKGKEFKIDCTGASARIFGLGNAKRWVWLHADLGDNNVVEVVSAVSKKKYLENLKPLSFVKIRFDGKEYPINSLLCAFFFKTEITDNSFRVSGRFPRLRVDIKVSQPRERCVVVDYLDPDGEAAQCINTEIADVDIRVMKKIKNEWEEVFVKRLEGCGHSEIGIRQ